MKRGLAYIIPEPDGWKSGVETFTNMVRDVWTSELDCVLVEKPPVKGPARVGEEDARAGKQASAPAEDGFQSWPRLVLGYLLELLADVRFVFGQRRATAGRTLITDQFGCETLPIAMRLVHPFSKIIAICHTHPGRDARSSHFVRRFLERSCYRAATDLVYNSHSVREEWGRKLGIAEPKGSVIWYGIPGPDLDVPADYPPKPDGVIDFVYVAQFWPWKGQENLLKIWRDLVAGGEKKIRLVFVGGGHRLEQAKQLAEELALGDSVVFLGVRENGAVYFNGGDVGVLLSIETEAFGIVLLEAGSRKMPVLASRLGGIREAVVDGETGILVDPFSYDEVASAVTELAGSPDRRRELGRKGYERWQENFHVDRMIEDYREYLSS